MDFKSPVGDNKARESLTALFLVSVSVICLVIGLFTIKDTANSSDKDSAKLVSNLVGDKVAVIGIEGVIHEGFYTKSAFGSNHLSSTAAKKELLKALDDKQIKAVLLRINSPGGTVGASQEIYQLVQKLREAGKPVVSSMGDICTSGCYYIASVTDRIMANPGTLTGSIGVIAQGFDAVDLMQKVGVGERTFKAGKFKDLASPFRPISPEETALMQGLLDDAYDQFLGDVALGRGIERDVLNNIAEGIIYSGRQAVENNLIDELGSYEDSKDLIKEVLEKEYEYKKAGSIKFEETWSQKSGSPLEDLLGFALPESSSSFFTGLLSSFGLSMPAALAPEFNPMSKYQPLWLSR